LGHLFHTILDFVRFGLRQQLEYFKLEILPDDDSLEKQIGVASIMHHLHTILVVIGFTVALAGD